jgi:regulator of protease activity HflC (stomatin/prohibitin superfamily)
MKKILSGIFALLMMTQLSGCSDVPSGFVAVKVDRYGDTRGVQNEVVGPGRYFSGPNTDYFLFPSFSQNEIWAKGNKEGDQSISFQTKEGMTVNADFGMTYSVKRENVSAVFQKYRRGIGEISDMFLRVMLRDALNDMASKKSVDEMMNDKVAFMSAVQADVITRASASGIAVESISTIGEFRWPAQILAAVNAKMTATQDAMKVENELRKTQAEAQKAITKAQAEVQIAEAEAKSIALRGQALDKNPGVLKQQWIEKWDGRLPSTVTGAGTDVILNLGK